MRSSEPRLATTVVVLRPGPEGPEVFLVQRDRRVGFMPSAWVFPGGRVDPADGAIPASAVHGLRPLAERLRLSDEAARQLVAAAFRETFEESGIWLGRGGPTEEDRRALCARGGDRTLGHVIAGSGVELDAARLAPLSRWVTPIAEPRRYDTWFFVARVPAGTVGRHDEGETVQSAWLPIPRAIERADRGDLPMAPPTWWTLRQLLHLGDLDNIEGTPHDLEPVCPVLLDVDGKLTLALPGHPAHGEPARAGWPTAIDFAQGRWWATGGGDGRR